MPHFVQSLNELEASNKFLGASLAGDVRYLLLLLNGAMKQLAECAEELEDVRD